MSPPQAWHCALNSPIKRCSVLVPSVSPVCLPAPGVGGASQPYLPCNQACVPRGGSCLAPHPLICPCPVGPGTAMDGQLLPVLLLLLGASGLWGQGPGPEGPLEEPPEEEPPEEEPPEEDGILVLSRQTLGLALREHPALLVEFYAPWCGHCKALAPEYSKAAALLAAESAKVRLAKVDGPAEPELAEEFAVTKYPTLKFFLDGNHTHPEEYTGPWEAEGIAEWLRRRVGPSATRLEDEEGAQALIDAQDVVVIGFFQDLQDKDVATFLALAQDALDMSFGLTNQPQLFQKFSLTKDTVVLFKKYDEGRADFPVDEELGLDQGDLSRFLLTHSMHLVTEFNSQTSRKIFAAGILNHLLLFVNQTLAPHRELLAGFREAAPSFRGQVLFVVVDVGASNDHVLQYFGLKAEEAPTLRFINIETTKKYMPADRGPVTATSVAAFCHAVLGGEVKPYRLSQEVPPDWDQRPVKTLVGKNFEQVAFDETKNVFIKFYAPWCTHCKEMAPAWEALAEKYRDHEDIVIAELDATANELEALPVHSFPTLKYFPAGPGRKVIEYKGTRDLETFSKFLDSGGELPAEEPTEVPGAPFPVGVSVPRLQVSGGVLWMRDCDMGWAGLRVQLPAGSL
ncbi:protein disulfide-isomerase A2 isoform X2 [Lagenorhynchus albirostris]|uniref:protein disulfide-isomerase A2 isoform X2 n=1 Tax=Lagenorhynchus albirostris TaxID=27610 RepID=UPI0028EA33FE|nr:protein disulfide-isomerase A2 isoform X2 [Lagenorhynchus albirostris]